MSNLEVFKVSNNTAKKTAEANNSEITDYSTLTFIVTAAQAHQLYQIENGGAKYKLLLKPRVSGGSSVEITPEVNYNCLEVIVMDRINVVILLRKLNIR